MHVGESLEQRSLRCAVLRPQMRPPNALQVFVPEAKIGPPTTLRSLTSQMKVVVFTRVKENLDSEIERVPREYSADLDFHLDFHPTLLF